MSLRARGSHILNAQLRLRGKARAPFSVRLRGRVQLSGCGEVLLGEGVSLNGTVVPIELVTYASGRIEIGNHTFLNYGSSIAARASVKIGAHSGTVSMWGDRIVPVAF